jgi:hypothetical protein
LPELIGIARSHLADLLGLLERGRPENAHLHALEQPLADQSRIGAVMRPDGRGSAPLAHRYEVLDGRPVLDVVLPQELQLLRDGHGHAGRRPTSDTEGVLGDAMHGIESRNEALA